MTVEGLNKNTTACFVKTTSHLSNSAKVGKACSGCGEDMFSHWRRFVKNIGWANQNIVGAEGGKK